MGDVLEQLESRVAIGQRPEVDQARRIVGQLTAELARQDAA
jgi:hypothetical protein